MKPYKDIVMLARVSKCENVCVYHLNVEKTHDLLRDKLLGELAEAKAKGMKPPQQYLHTALWTLLRKHITR